MSAKIVLVSVICAAALAAAVLVLLAASGYTLWPEGGETASPATPSTQATRGTHAAPAPPASPAAAAIAVPETPAAAPASVPATPSARCIAVAARDDTDPAVLAADQRICDCLNRTLKANDFAMLLSFTEIDRRVTDYATRVGALYQRYRMTESQFGNEIERIRAAGRSCIRQ